MTAVAWIIVIIALLLFLFLPRIGLLALYRNHRLAQERERAEDALKHLLDREHQGRHASAESLAGSLRLSQPDVMRLIDRLESQELVQSHGPELHLTAEGERYAIHVVRAHRLWERYLADEARMPLDKIHEEAHRREHNLTEAELDELDAALGHPAFDPHGDPLPSRRGTFAAVDGKPLTEWQADAPARIVHIEDEPSIAYEQILAAGLRLGQTIRLLEHTPARIVVSDGENEYRLAPSVASNVYLIPLPERQRVRQDLMPLAALQHDQHAEIIALDDALQGFTRRRFLDLGLTPGTMIYPELKNFFHDPRGYRVRGTLIALRRDQAMQIWVKPVG